MKLGKQSAGRDLRVRYVYLGAAMLLGLSVLAVRLYRLQIVRGAEYRAKSEANYIKEIRVPAVRGMILDRRGEILADNRPSFDVQVTPAFCQRCAEDVLPRLGQWLGWDNLTAARADAEVKAGKRNAPFQPVTVNLDLSRDQLDLVNAHLRELSGVEVLPVQHRSYRYAAVLAHVLGYMNEITQDELERLKERTPPYFLGDYIGRRGIERYYEDKLRGVAGIRKEVVNARGQVNPALTSLLPRGGEDQSPQPGGNVVLSIDYRLQEEAERAFPGVAGVVVAMEVKTGFILAMVSRPAFDPNVMTGRVTSAQLVAMSKDPLQPMVFRAVAQHYHPGSTFKPVTLLAALRSGSFTPRTMVSCPGGYRLGARLWRCWNDKGHGPVDPRAAMQRSCDTFFYKVADTLGLDPISRVGRELGLGEPTGIGIGAEVPGVMPDEAYHDRVTPGGYTKGMALNSAIGQGDDNVTPLQLAVVYATLANGGTVYQPQLVRRVESGDGQVVEEKTPRVLRTVEIKPEHHALIVDALASVVNEPGGTAYRSRLKEIKVAGKTGTAQVSALGAVRLKKEQMEYFDRDHAWFASFAPVEDPEIAVVVLNEHGGHGASDAAPTATAVIQKYFELKKGETVAQGQAAEER